MGIAAVKILLMSYAYPPSTGGIEMFSSIMRNAFIERGHEVRVVTHIQASAPEEQVLRRPALNAMREWISWADLCFVSGVSLNYQIPVVLQGKPMVVTHHRWQERNDGSVTLLQRLKLFLCRFGLNITVNCAIAADLPMPAIPIHNPVHSTVEMGAGFASRPLDLIYAGRLVSEKGLPVMLNAIARLRKRGVRVIASIVGDGPERQPLENQARSSGIADCVRFLGRLDFSQIPGQLAQHKMMVVPSVYKEPFPMAVLEGLAAGCMLVASHAGGLPEGVGPCGVTFPMGNDAVLADLIEQVLADPAQAEVFRAAIPAHLATMEFDRTVDRYLDAFQRFYRYRAIQRMSGPRAARLTVADLTAIG